MVDSANIVRVGIFLYQHTHGLRGRLSYLIKLAVKSSLFWQLLLYLSLEQYLLRIESLPLRQYIWNSSCFMHLPGIRSISHSIGLLRPGQVAMQMRFGGQHSSVVALPDIMDRSRLQVLRDAILIQNTDMVQPVGNTDVLDRSLRL